MDQVARGAVERTQIEAVVLRAVPCADHDAYVVGCPDCLTGEQAAAAGASTPIDLGVVSDSDWGPCDPRRIRAGLRTRRANRSVGR